MENKSKPEKILGSRSEDYWIVLYGNGTGTLVVACVVLHACWDFWDARTG